MGLFGRLFGSNKHDATDPQGHLKTKSYKRLDWEIDDNEYTKQDYIASTEYIIPSDQTIREIFGKLDSSENFVVNDVFFRVDYMGHSNDWYKQRDYTFKELTLKKKEKTEDETNDIYILEGTGTFLKEDFTGTVLASEKNDVSIHAEITYKNNKLDIRNCCGFDDTDNWYAFMLFFKVLEYYKYPTETCKTVKVSVFDE
ncbi:hypothetical protein MmiEs2_08210 [Methanimicrococcus stummii]|uniref:Uncharacterized protein n=1 Tax=Methanimicrococcus stummii TaxID=3028294 RepID=A0AA96ZX39_9EURY|nr:hypothetical protein [Methanimicrococcus sp. Es2]WNY28625.1 hypothetical protein MmiEs2_08210 [Methanimicrococcus sp. Es2]